MEERRGGGGYKVEGVEAERFRRGKVSHWKSLMDKRVSVWSIRKRVGLEVGVCVREDKSRVEESARMRKGGPWNGLDWVE